MKLKIAITLIMAMFICVSASSQTKKNKKSVLTGKVINRESTPIKGVMIFVDGLKIDNSSNKKGEFKLKISPDSKKIAFYSFTNGGYELDYYGQTETEIILDPDFPMITITPSDDGTSIETGYATYSRDEVTGTISTIREGRYENNTYNNIFEMIAGEVPGVTVNGSSVRIRGLSSFNISNQPLFVVNGSPMQYINHISPRDVKSINILKGPQTAMYGSRGSAGVIVITTKGSGK